MSKELVVSAGRHETRVAILEDDQLVEIFYQREKEYSLAGSIHKGRVTRVLPGMQSAFVDIGLERDAFLYVSDFFEDNEEYDKVVSVVEEKILKMEKGIAVIEPVTSEPSPAGDPLPASLAEVVPTEAVAELAAPVAEAPRSSEPRQDRDGRGGDRGGDRGGRGRRGRRRRGGRGGSGGGLPDSKFYQPRQDEGQAAGTSAPDEAIEPHEAAEADDFMLLPGESLAKYSSGEAEPNAPAENPEQHAGPAHSEPAIDLRREVRAAVEPPPLPAEVLAKHAEPKVEAAVPEPAGIVAAMPALEPVVQSAPEPVPAHVEVAPVAQAEPELLHDAAPIAAEPEHALRVPLPEIDGVHPVHDLSALHLEAVAEHQAESEVGPDELGELAEPAVTSEEGPEPARMPTSLTATLREQGSRFPHRLSRRARRKIRGGGPDGRNNEAPAGTEAGEESAVAPVAEVAVVPAPQENRPQRERGRGDRGDRGDRGERGERPDRGERGERGDRGERADRGDRGDRAPVPSITELLKEGQEIIVQIAKEPLGQKGARITSHIALPGRFLVYMPTVDHVGVSRKIPSDDERQRLKKILQANRTGMTGGFIVRTAGEGKSEEDLRADMHFLYNLWLDMRQKAEKRPAPVLLHHDLDVVQRILRDQLTSNFKTIWVDQEEAYESVLRFVQRFQPALVSRVKLYTRTNPIFDEFNISTELEKALRPKVWLKSGGYIVINQTEALVAIDVNTGKYVGKSNRLEDTIVRVNTDAIKEIVRQIRLRDLGGIIVVDFIDMDERKNRQKVMQVLEEAMRVDRAPYKILAFNDFGLVAITRKRVKQSLERTLCSPCPTCEGAGHIKSVPTVIGEIIQEAQKMAKVVEGDHVLLRVNPEVAKVLKSNRNDHLQELEEILGRTVMVKSDPSLHQTKFDLA